MKWFNRETRKVSKDDEGCQDVSALNDSDEVSISILYDVRTSRRDLLKVIHSVQINVITRVHTHSAFALGYEAGINKSTVDGNLVPPSCLITFVQKRIQYLELEETASNDDTDMDEDFQFLQPIDLITTDVEILKEVVRHEENGKAGDPEPMEICTSSTSLTYSTARIWTIRDGPCNSHMQNGPVNVMVLKHFKGRTNYKSKDISTTLEWNGEGNLLATGSYDGQTTGSYDGQTTGFYDHFRSMSPRRTRRNNNGQQPQPADPLNKNVYHAEFLAAFQALAQAVIANVQANPDLAPQQ
ncbi:hypothetical protein FXO37_00331 [Capsicum annuum]|nr:hypothetical protein FXO37_00331 [Capsicum annuum]